MGAMAEPSPLEEAVARVRLGHAFEGAPGRAHGGIVASIFDDVMGIVLTIHSTPAFTARRIAGARPSEGIETTRPSGREATASSISSRR